MRILAPKNWRLVWVVLALLALLLCGVRTAYAGPITYWKVVNPPDVNKVDDPLTPGVWPENGDNSCWLASAADLLSAAGYGNGAAIYGTLTGHYGTAAAGFADTALSWYLQNFPMAGNPYTIVTGYITGLTPSFIASEMRRSELVSIGIYPTKDLQVEGHAISVWGDDGPNPGSAAVTDSDRSPGGAWEQYDWAAPANPGEPWRLMYGGTTAWYLGYVATLCDTPEPGTWMLVLLGAGGVWLIRRGRVRGT
jgi:hypothetical protein